jgi:hypothetical protein
LRTFTGNRLAALQVSDFQPIADFAPDEIFSGHKNAFSNEFMQAAPRVLQYRLATKFSLGDRK